MGDLQGFLEKNNVPFDKEPPKAQLEAAARDSGGQGTVWLSYDMSFIPSYVLN